MVVGYQISILSSKREVLLMRNAAADWKTTWSTDFTMNHTPLSGEMQLLHTNCGGTRAKMYSHLVYFRFHLWKGKEVEDHLIMSVCEHRYSNLCAGFDSTTEMHAFLVGTFGHLVFNLCSQEVDYQYLQNYDENLKDKLFIKAMVFECWWTFQSQVAQPNQLTSLVALEKNHLICLVWYWCNFSYILFHILGIFWATKDWGVIKCTTRKIVFSLPVKVLEGQIYLGIIMPNK